MTPYSFWAARGGCGGRAGVARRPDREPGEGFAAACRRSRGSRRVGRGRASLGASRARECRTAAGDAGALSNSAELDHTPIGAIANPPLARARALVLPPRRRCRRSIFPGSSPPPRYIARARRRRRSACRRDHDPIQRTALEWIALKGSPAPDGARLAAFAKAHADWPGLGLDPRGASKARSIRAMPPRGKSMRSSPGGRRRPPPASSPSPAPRSSRADERRRARRRRPVAREGSGCLDRRRDAARIRRDC